MMYRSLGYDPTPEDRATRAKWARGVGIVYGTILLLLLAFIAAERILAEHGRATETANDPAAQPTLIAGSRDATLSLEQRTLSPHLQTRIAP
jgi:hypothetical protein